MQVDRAAALGQHEAVDARRSRPPADGHVDLQRRLEAGGDDVLIGNASGGARPDATRADNQCDIPLAAGVPDFLARKRDFPRSAEVNDRCILEPGTELHRSVRIADRCHLRYATINAFALIARHRNVERDDTSSKVRLALELLLDVRLDLGHVIDIEPA